MPFPRCQIVLPSRAGLASSAGISSDEGHRPSLREGKLRVCSCSHHYLMKRDSNGGQCIPYVMPGRHFRTRPLAYVWLLLLPVDNDESARVTRRVRPIFVPIEIQLNSTLTQIGV